MRIIIMGDLQQDRVLLPEKGVFIMVHGTAVLKSEYDGLGLSVLWVVPGEGSRGVVQISHGMSENKERYLPFMEYLAKRGYICVIHDHRGHGKSVHSQNELGYLYGGSNKAMVEDLHQVTLWSKEMFPDLPVYLLGHSMGSLVARNYLKYFDNELEKLILTGPPCENPAVNVGLFIAKTQKKHKGGLYPSKLLEAMSFGSFASRFAGEKSRFAWICSDEEVVKDYEQSPLCGFTFTADGFEGLLMLLRETYSKEGWRLQNPELPILFLGGADDPCIGNGRKFVKELQHMRQVGYRHVTGKLYPGMRHEILNEKDKLTVYQNIYQYLEK